MESIEKLRTAARNMAKGMNLEEHEECNLLLVIADEIEREHKQRINELNGAICELDGRIGSYERRNTELNDALKVICKHFGVSVELSAEDAAKKVLEALERDYMRLPCDADGVPIRVGDKLRGVYETFEVCAVSEHYAYWEYGRHWDKAIECRHVKQRTLTDVLADLFDRKMSVTDAEHEISELLGGDA